MNLVSRIIGAIIIIFIFTIIIIASFFSKDDYTSTVDFSLKEEGKQEMNIGGLGEKLYINNVSGFEYIFSSLEDISILQEGKEQEIDISKNGKYFSSLKDINKTYIFSGEGYEIEQEGIGELFIDTSTRPGKVFIFSLNVPVRISLTNASGSEKYTDIFLNPHMYLEFQPARGRSFKNADVIRIQTVYKLGYIGETFREASNTQQKNIYSNYVYKNRDFINTSLDYLLKRDSLRKKLLSDIRGSKVGKIPGYDKIQKYMQLFVNNEKKKVFYKNIVLERLLQVLQAEEYNKSNIIGLLEDFQQLKILDPSSFQDLKNIQENIAILLSSNNEARYIPAQISFSQLRNTGEKEQGEKFQLYGNILFSQYEMENIFSEENLYIFLQSFPYFTQERGEDILQIQKRYQYFSYFLEQYLFFLLEKEGTLSNIRSISDTLDNYMKNISLAYDDTVVSQVTSLYVYNNILKSIGIFLRTQYFLPERTKEGNLLQLLKNQKISYQEIKKLELLIEKIFTIYNLREKSLDDTSPRDISIQKDMLEYKKNLSEYFVALRNYEEYSSRYDLSKKNLLDVQIFGADENTLMSLELIKEYLNTFSGVSLEDVRIKLIDNSYYRVENMYVLGSLFSFDLYPRLSYKMTNIRIDKKESNFEYKLSYIQNLWEEKYKTASEDERDRYDFSRFFIVSFFSQDNPKVEEYDNLYIKENEDKSEIVFKRDRLLGVKGEFSTLYNIFSINYEDIRIVKQDTFYDIFLEGVLVKIPIDLSGSKITKSALLSSQYILDDTRHYFQNMTFKIYKESIGDNKSFLFNGENIIVLGKIQIFETEEILQNIFNSLNDYQQVYSSIARYYPDSSVLIEYNVKTKRTSFKFDSDTEKYTIIIWGGVLEKIYKGTKKILGNKTDISNISQYLQ